MESPTLSPAAAQILSPSSSGRRSRGSCSTSPEFEFWMVRNPSFPQPNLLSADQLFDNGVLLPLHRLSQTPQPDPDPPSSNPDPEPGPGPELLSAVITAPESTAASSTSKRWRDIFKKSDKKNQDDKSKEKEKEKEKEKKKVDKERKSNTAGASSAELNINIWPFSRSRSAGTATTRPKLNSGSTRKVNSAPCSRSNSAGESKSRKWPSSPGRPGVHLGRSSPVWQVRRSGSGSKNSDPMFRSSEKTNKKDVSDTRRARTAPSSSSGGPTTKAKVLNLNVPMCIGYRHHLSCRSDEHSALGGGGGDNGNDDNNRKTVTGGSSGESNSTGNNLFNLRSLFTKKVY